MSDDPHGLTLVTVGILVAAARAGPDDVAVGEKFAGLLVVGLESCLDGEFPFVVEVAEKFGSRLVVELRSGA